MKISEVVTGGWEMRCHHKYTDYTRYNEFKKLDSIVRAISEYFASVNNRRGLDLGCGVGNITILLACLGYQMVGVDSSSAAIKMGQDKSRKARFLSPQGFVEFFGRRCRKRASAGQVVSFYHMLGGIGVFEIPRESIGFSF